MTTAALAGRLLALVVWVGGVIFFAFVVAPVSFGQLPSTHEAGLVVGACLRVLHWMGLVAGAVFLAISLGVVAATRRVAWFVGVVAVLVMVGLTALSQFGVLPRMERDRVTAGGDVLAGRQGDAVQRAAAGDFDRLHVVSERMEGGVLLLGLAAVVALAAERRAA